MPSVLMNRGAVGMGVLTHSAVLHACGCHPVNASSAPHHYDNLKEPRRSPKALWGTVPLRAAAFDLVFSDDRVLNIKLSSDLSLFTVCTEVPGE